MAGLLRQKGKEVRVVNSSPTPPRYDYLDPDGSLFEHFGKTARPADLADREVAIILTFRHGTSLVRWRSISGDSEDRGS